MRAFKGMTTVICTVGHRTTRLLYVLRVVLYIIFNQVSL